MAGVGITNRSSREVVNLHTDIFDFLCTFHRVKRLPSKDTNPGAIADDEKTSDEQRGELINRYLYKILNEIELRISALEIVSEPVSSDFYDEWAFLTWALLGVLNRLQLDTVESKTFLDYRGKHFKEMINSALVELVNKAQRMQPPEGVSQNHPAFERFYQAYVSTLISLHHLMNRQPATPTGVPNNAYTVSQTANQLSYQEFEAHVEALKDQMSICFRLQREFCNSHKTVLWQRMRESQLRKMTEYEYEDKNFMTPSTAFYSNMLYNLGVLAARLQGFHHELCGNNVFAGEEADVVKPLLRTVYAMVDALLCDALLCVEPSQNAILVTNNLFPMKVVSLCRCLFFRDFSLQIVSEEVAQQIQEMRQRKALEPRTAAAAGATGTPMTPLSQWPSQSAALLAMKPSSGVKRNNATASAEGGNTAHKKSDVNSKEWISIPPLFDSEHQCWIATYPHLLCTTRQKDTLLDTRSATQTGKRPLFYFHVKAEIFGFSGTFSSAHTLSLPFTIATRRNQDCQVQRMMSSYTATCFWLYGTKIIDGLMIQWYDNEIDWKQFKVLYAKHFSLNAEVRRTLVDSDFNVLRHKMHCRECTDQDNSANNTTGQNGLSEALTVTFKNVLCPHLHYTAGKVDLHFSIWRGMLELQHLFSDQRTDVKTLWENGLLQGFMEPEKVNDHLRTVESGLVMRLSFVMGCCVCFSIRSSSEVLELEPLDVRRLQSKSLHEYLRDILTAERVKYVLNVNEKWIQVNEVIKMSQRISTLDSYNLTSKEVKSNAMSTGSIEIEETFRFTPMRIAVVTCKQSPSDDGKLDVSSTTFQSLNALDKSRDQSAGGDFGERLDALLAAYGKSRSYLATFVGGPPMRNGVETEDRQMNHSVAYNPTSSPANSYTQPQSHDVGHETSCCYSQPSTSHHHMQSHHQQPQPIGSMDMGFHNTSQPQPQPQHLMPLMTSSMYDPSVSHISQHHQMQHQMPCYVSSYHQSHPQPHHIPLHNQHNHVGGHNHHPMIDQPQLHLRQPQGDLSVGYDDSSNGAPYAKRAAFHNPPPSWPAEDLHHHHSHSHPHPHSHAHHPQHQLRNEEAGKFATPTSMDLHQHWNMKSE